MARLLISVGESSGDQRAAALLSELGALVPGLDAFGMGGPALRAAGCRVLVDSTPLDVMGFAEPIRKLPQLRAALGELVALAAREKPDAALLCDYPGFNLRLAARLKERGVRVIYYVSPQVWAWAPGRAARIARMVDRMLVLFPFEVEVYHRAGLPAEFVGHPLADELPGDHARGAAALRAELGISPDQELLAILPGSRPMELERHLPVFSAAAALIAKSRPAVRPAIAVVPRTDTTSIAAAAGAAAGKQIPVLAGRTREVLAAADMALTVSGTATLEAALLGCPMLVCYRTGLLNYLLGRLLVTIPCIALPNVIAGRPLVPELWQWEVAPERVADSTLAVLEDAEARAEMRERLCGLRETLGVRGASRRAAEAVARELDAGA
jgi:lipid-A-disaccharide synthase